MFTIKAVIHRPEEPRSSITASESTFNNTTIFSAARVRLERERSAQSSGPPLPLAHLELYKDDADAMPFERVPIGTDWMQHYQAVFVINSDGKTVDAFRA